MLAQGRTGSCQLILGTTILQDHQSIHDAGLIDGAIVTVVIVANDVPDHPPAPELQFAPAPSSWACSAENCPKFLAGLILSVTFSDLQVVAARYAQVFYAVLF